MSPLAPRPGAAVLVLSGWVLGLTGCSPAAPRSESLPVIAASNWEFDVRTDGSVVPVYFGPTSKEVRLCLEVDPSTDTTQWEAVLYAGEDSSRDGTFVKPSARLVSTVCFERAQFAWQAPPDVETRLCAAVRDRYVQREVTRSCAAVRWRPEPARHQELWRDAQAAMRSTGAGATLDAVLERLEALADDAAAQGLVALPERIRLLAVSVAISRGGEEQDRWADQRLAELPAWTSRPEAVEFVARRSFEAAELERKRHGPTATAWRLLGQAESGFARIASSLRTGVMTRQAELLNLAGASLEARRRLEQALEDCRNSKCSEQLESAARITWAWYAMEAPDAPREDLLRARDWLRESLAMPLAGQSVLTLTNEWINLAYVQLRLGEDARPALAEAGRRLAEMETRVGRAAELLGWTRLLSGLAALAEGDPTTALESCSERIGWQAGEEVSVAAEALACAAQASRARGELDRAASFYEQLLLLRESRSPLALEQSIAVSSSRRAEDYYEAVRVEVERRNAEKAWEILGRLDELAVQEEAMQVCRSSDRAPLAGELVDERERAMAALSALSRPAAGSLRAERARLMAEAKASLQTLSRELSRCEAAPANTRPSSPDLRAVALTDEILLLERDRAKGEVRLLRRTALERSDLLLILAELDHALEARDVPDDRWRQRAAPLGDALAPPRALEGNVYYGLYGALQRAPLAALPLERGWLADRVVPVLLPAAAGVSAVEADPANQRASPEVFVIDPRRNLPAGPLFARRVRQLQGNATFLEGSAATIAAVRRALTGATVLHVDAHARFEAAFPELSSLELADGSLQLVDLASLPTPRELVNLSACHSGDWPVTADSGRFGLAGHFARRGTAWVVASRADLDDTLALELNLELYGARSRGLSVPEAFSAALRALRATHPAASWGGLLLLSGGAPGNLDSSLLPR